jgi:hypothetical protein
MMACLPRCRTVKLLVVWGAGASRLPEPPAGSSVRLVTIDQVGGGPGGQGTGARRGLQMGARVGVVAVCYCLSWLEPTLSVHQPHRPSPA